MHELDDSLGGCPVPKGYEATPFAFTSVGVPEQFHTLKFAIPCEECFQVAFLSIERYLRVFGRSYMRSDATSVQKRGLVCGMTLFPPDGATTLLPHLPNKQLNTTRSCWNV